MHGKVYREIGMTNATEGEAEKENRSTKTLRPFQPLPLRTSHHSIRSRRNFASMELFIIQHDDH
jgi:hypothetical protein